MPKIYQIGKDAVVIDNGYPRGKLVLTRDKEQISVEVVQNGETLEVFVRADDLWCAINRIQII